MAKQFDVIEHEIVGNDMQAVVITLDPGEQVIAASRTMLYMGAGIMVKADMGVACAATTGQCMDDAGSFPPAPSFSTTTFVNEAQSRSCVAFAAPYPGRVLPIDLALHSGQVICQENAFLCAAGGTEISMAFQKKLAAALFGPDGFVLHRISGGGMAFAHGGGTVVIKELAAGEIVRIHPGCIVVLDDSVQYDIQLSSGSDYASSRMPGLFQATLTGPGRAYLQTLPFSRLADRIIAAAHQTGKGLKNEVSPTGGAMLGQ